MTAGQPPRAVVIGHRGAAAIAPENTVASLRAALDAGAAWIEFDVRLTADGQPVLLHDATLDRTTDATGPLSDIGFDALRALDAGSWFDDRFRGEPVPTLDEALDVLGNHTVAVVELKTGHENERDLPVAVANVLGSRRGRFLVTAMHWAPLDRFRAACGDIPIALSLSATDRRDPIEAARRMGAVAIHPYHRRVDRAFVDRAHRAGLAVRPYTLNTVAQFAWAAEMAVDAFFTDDPAAALAAPDTVS